MYLQKKNFQSNVIITCVSQIQHGRNKLGNREFRVEVKYAVEKNINGRTAGNDEAAPPPAIILSTDLEISHYDRYLSAADHQNAKDEKQKAEQVVELILPYGRKHEEQLDEDGAKGQDASH